MGWSYSIRRRLTVLAGACIAGLFAAPVGGQVPGQASFTVFVRSMAVGNEQVRVERTGQGWTISSSGRLGPPLDILLRALRARYDAEWKPIELTLDVTARGQASLLTTTVEGTTAKNIITPFNQTPAEKSDPIDAHAVFLPAPFAAPYEALAARLKTATTGSSISLYQPTAGSFPLEVGESSTEHIKTVDRTVEARRTRVTFKPPNAPPLAAEIWSDESGRLLRVSVPSQRLELARDDVASVAARLVTMSRPNDEDVRIPANGFSLAGTVSKPANAGGLLPAIVLLGGSGPADRDETLFGIPLFGQLANKLADAGFLVLRYDKRGTGQSGGRPEAATLADFAEDAKAAVRLISDRKDVDKRRVTLVGHGEGGWIAMLAAAKNDRVSTVVLVATVGTTGRDLNLSQVTRTMERSSRTPEEKQSTIELQKKIQQAVITGKGWEAPELAGPIRRQADTPYFQSFLLFDPAKVMKDLRQPLLVVQGGLDAQVPASNADLLEVLAKMRKGPPAVAVAKVPGVNHLLIPAKTGEPDEYASLPDRSVSAEVTAAIISWLGQAAAARK